MLGLGSGLAASDVLFSALKWLGAGYLAYLGIVSLLSTASTLAVPDACAPEVGARALFARGMLVGASNPKALLFFGALFPQFVEPSAPQAGQFLVLVATFIFFELFWRSVYAGTAARARHWLQKPRRATLFNRATGVVFLLAAGLVRVERHDRVRPHEPGQTAMGGARVWRPGGSGVLRARGLLARREPGAAPGDVGSGPGRRSGWAGDPRAARTWSAAR